MARKLFKFTNFLIGPFALTVAIFYLFPELNFQLLARNFSASESIIIVISFCLISLNFVASTVRFGTLNRSFGSSDGWLYTHKINILSSLYALVGIPLVMQITGRIIHGSETARRYYSSITILEKMVSLLVMFCTAMVFSAIYLNTSLVKIDFLLALVIVGAVFGLCFLSLLPFIFSLRERRAFLALFKNLLRIKLHVTFLLTICMQVLILCSHVLLAYQFLDTPNVLKLFGAFSIVILATMLPIGFGGIGIREATAGAIFMAFELPPEVGVISAALYSMLFLLALGLNFLVAKNVENRKTNTAMPSFGIDGSVIWCVTGLLLLSAICFQIRVPLQSGQLTLNFGDVLAIAISGTVLAAALHHKQHLPYWASRFMWPGLICFGIMICLGWLIGWLRFGSNEWATANRLLGLISVSSFLMSGFAVRQKINIQDLSKIFVFASSIFILSSLSSIAIQTFSVFDLSHYYNWSDALTGFVGDRNAYAFLGLMLATALMFCSQKSLLSNYALNANYALTGALLAFVMASGSRSGIGGILVIFVLWALTNRRASIVIALSTIVSASVLYATMQLLYLFQDMLDLQQPTVYFLSSRGIDTALEISKQRIMTWNEGIRLFLKYPIFGAGLGAAIQNIGIVVHNSFLWVAAEMGVLGLLLSLPITLVVVQLALSKTGLSSFNNRVALIGFVLICGGFSLVQDIVYQRSLWLMLGFLCALDMTDGNSNAKT